MVEDTAYRTADLSSTLPTFAANLSAFGLPSEYVGLALFSSCAALALFVAAIARARRGATGGTRNAHPYREPTEGGPVAPAASSISDDARTRHLAFCATIVALAGVAGLASTLAQR